ncbi:MAG: 3'-5' exonuclease [Clostridiaceae bacterium]|nr:3'-5' exonuclease [Clostridiaceae bacterium]
MTEFDRKYAALRQQVIGREFKNLNEMQRQAVFQTEGPLLLLAGAGSGKTTVLINRIINLLRFGKAYHWEKAPGWAGEAELSLLEQTAADPEALPDSEILRLCAVEPPKPWEIIAITFTNKAAGELRDRLSVACGEAGDDVWAHTFHTACTRILRRNIQRLGYASSFTIYDDDDRKRMVTAVMRDLSIDDRKFEPKAVMGEISRAKDELMTPTEYAEQAGADFYRSRVAKIYAEYQRRMKEASALDFDDIIFRTVELLQTCDDVREYYQGKFRYVLVDEYQDTNHAQYVLCSLLAGGHHNLCVVGDDDQSIYKFRGATIANILEFEQQFRDARTIRLEQNYRSTGNILDAANGVISNNVGRKGKTLWTQNGTGEKVRFYCAPNQEEEARFIAQIIRQGRTRGDKLRDYAVLYRNNALSNSLQSIFARSGVPFVVVRGHAFLDSAEVKDVRAYLELINNPADTLRLRRIINVPARKLGAKTLETLAEVAAREGITELAAARRAPDLPDFSAQQAAALRAFAELILGLAARQDEVPLMELYEELLERSGYLQAMQNIPDARERENRTNNVMELKSNIAQYCRDTEETTLSGFLEGLSLLADVDNLDPEADAVPMMTMHSAKGLEFPVVFVVGAEEGLFPSYRAMDTTDELEEERRLCYVAMTRAKRELYITCARQRMLYGQTAYTKPSRFLGEIPAELLEETTWQTPAYTPPQQRSHAALSGTASGRSVGTFEGNPRKEAAKRAERARASRFSAGISVSSGASVGKTASFSQGQRIRHTAFGEGTVVETTPMGGDAMLRITFDDGKEKLMMAKTAAQYIKLL